MPIFLVYSNSTKFNMADYNNVLLAYNVNILWLPQPGPEVSEIP